jgi:1-phosphatidylinositol-3-phosphate 5-kinase
MDYSYVQLKASPLNVLSNPPGISRLLLGVDEERKQIHCGLVDTIGSYTFAKTLEYKAKGLSGKEGKDITVIPPHEYQERFVSALESYFMACPGACG